jgi:hypothetical protein
LAEISWLEQKTIEESETESFDDYLQRYFAQQL